MDTIISCLKLLIPITLLYICIKTEDKIVAQITGLIGLGIFLFNFIFLALWIKLIIVSIIYVVWRLRSDDIIAFFYRKFRK